LFVPVFVFCGDRLAGNYFCGGYDGAIQEQTKIIGYLNDLSPEI
jgi:hypothetical protein